ncbi:MAG: TorF family putative porin [Kiritimatiellales bacterium]
MKKLIFTAAIGIVAGLVFAQDVVMVEQQPSDVSVSADVGLYSAYVWRGQVLNDNMVVQPSVTAAKGPFSLNVWGNWNATENAAQDTGEIDYTAAYTLPFSTDDVTMDIGMIFYTFPGNGNSAPSTEEAFIKATFNNIILTPVASLYYDFDEADGFYGNLAVSQGVEISDAMTAEIGGSIGYGSQNYNKYYFGNDDAEGSLNDYNVYVSANYALTEKLTLGALLQYTMLDGSVDNSGYDANDLVWGGINLSYKFL